MSLFNIFEPRQSTNTVALPVYRDVKWDVVLDRPIYENGNPVFVERDEALITWIINALKTSRWQHEIFAPSYGSEFDKLIGQQYSSDLKQLEAAAYIKECLLVSPYIVGVTAVKIAFAGEVLSATFKVHTVYGNLEMEV